MNFNRIHLVIGITAVAAFLGTGLYMRSSFSGLYHGNEAIHYMYRANHVYILASGLLNVAFGIYSFPAVQQWKRIVHRFGSCLLLIAPLILLFAFFHEPPRGSPEKPVTLIGVICLLAGTVCHLPNVSFLSK